MNVIRAAEGQLRRKKICWRPSAEHCNGETLHMTNVRFGAAAGPAGPSLASLKTPTPLLERHG
jgi:hypothetical protein